MFISYNVFLCYKKGFLKSLALILNYFLGIVASYFLSFYILKKISQSSFFNLIEDEFFKNFNLSNGLKNISSAFSNDGFSLNSTIGSNLFNIFFSRIIFLVLFFLISFIFKIIRKYIFQLAKNLKKVRSIGKLDGFLGAICGILKAFIFLFLIALVYFVLLILTGDKVIFFNTKTVNSTYLFFLFYKITYFFK